MEQTLVQEITSSGGLSMAQVAKRLPPARQNKPVSPSCVWRWAMRGVRLEDGRRVKLEAVRLAGRWLTSELALARFIEAQQPQSEVEAVSKVRTPSQRRKTLEQAEVRLEERGV